MGCGGYWDKIYKILVDIATYLILKLVFRFPVFSYKAIFSDYKWDWILLILLPKSCYSMRIQQKFTLYEKICKWKTGLINQANKSKVVYLSADANAGPFKGQFLLVCWSHEVIQMIWLVNILIILFFNVLICYNTIQKRGTKVNFLRWIFFKTNYIWILIWYVMFHVQVEIGLYMSPTLEALPAHFMKDICW